MAALAIPSSAGPSSSTNSPAKEKKRKRAKVVAPKNYDEEAELEVSAEDLVAGDEGGEEGEGGARTREEGDGDGDDEDVDAAATMGLDVKREAKRRRDETLLLRGVLDEEQGKRFDAFRGVVIPKAVVKKLNKDLYDQNIPNNMMAIVAGMVKVFVADVVETAREIQPYSQHPTGPLQPYHLQTARLRLQEAGMLSTPSGVGSSRSSTGLRPRKKLFRR